MEIMFYKEDYVANRRPGLMQYANKSAVILFPDCPLYVQHTDSTDGCISSLWLVPVQLHLYVSISLSEI